MTQIGEALIDIVHQCKPAARRVVGWMREAAEPPDGVMLQSADGASYSGLIVVADNRPVLMLCAKTGNTRTLVTPPPVPTYSRPTGYSSGSSSYGSRRLFEEEDGNPDGWPHDPYGRR